MTPESAAQRRQAVLDRALREADKAIRHMLENRTIAHAFDVGKAPGGVELSMLLIVLPKTTIDSLMAGIFGKDPTEVDL